MIKKAFLCFMIASITQIHAAQAPILCPAALYLALANQSTQDFAKLLNERPELANSVDWFDIKTILMRAAHMNKPDHMRLLIQNGALLNMRDSKGETALLYAVERESIEPTRLLVEAGAEIDCVSNEGKTALSIARHNYQNPSKKKFAPAFRQIADYVHLQLSTQISTHQSYLTATGLSHDLIREIVQFLFHPQVVSELEQNTTTALTVSRQLAGIKKKPGHGKRKKMSSEQDATQSAAKKKKQKNLILPAPCAPETSAAQ